MVIMNKQYDNIDHWLDVIEDHMEFNEPTFYLKRECTSLVESLIKHHSDGKVNGNYFSVKGEKNFSHEAITMRIKDIGLHPVLGGTWEVHGEYCEDYYEWIGNFVAFFHTDDSSEWVIGHHEDYVLASSENIYYKFMNHFKPERWDYHDI